MIQRISDMRKRNEGDDGGFTLIELLVVIIILGILAAVVVFSVSGINDTGEDAAQAIDARTLRTAEEAFFAQNGFYASEADLVAAGFLSEESVNNDVELSGPPGAADNYTVSCTISPTNDCQAAQEGGAVVRGGTMVVASGNLGGPYNPAITSDGGRHPLAEPMFNGLLAFDPSGNVVPDLAASMPTVTNNGDGTQDVDVTLRSGIKWHDSGVVNSVYNTTGADQFVSAADVVFSYTKAILIGQGRTGASMGPALGYDPSSATFPGGGSITATGPLTVRFHFLHPYAPLLSQMNVTEAPIIPQHVYAHCALVGGGSLGGYPGPNNVLVSVSGNSCPANSAPVGSGPFQWSGQTGAQISAAGAITLNKNPQYFKAGLPYLEKLILQATANAASALSASRGTAGSVDIGGVSATALTTPFNFSASSDYAVASVPRGSGGGNCINTLSFNLWQPVKTNAATGHSLSYYNGQPGMGPNGLPGNSPEMSQAAIVGEAPNAPYNNPILSSFLVRKALFEGFNRGQAAINSTGVPTAVGAPVGTLRMADSIYHSNLTIAYAPTTFPGSAGGAPDVAQAEADLDAAGWDGPRVPAAGFGGGGIRTWGDHGAGDPVPLPQQTVLGLAPGTKLQLDLTHHFSSTQPAQSVQFVSDMKAIGVEIFDRNLQTGSGASAWATLAAGRNFQIGLTSYCHGDNPVIGSQRQYISTAIPLAFAANTSGYRDQGASPGDNSMDGLWYQANRATSNAASTAIYGQIQAKELSVLSQIPVDESASIRVSRTVCDGINNQNTGLYAEAAYCAG